MRCVVNSLTKMETCGSSSKFFVAVLQRHQRLGVCRGRPRHRQGADERQGNLPVGVDPHGALELADAKHFHLQQIAGGDFVFGILHARLSARFDQFAGGCVEYSWQLCWFSWRADRPVRREAANLSKQRKVKVATQRDVNVPRARMMAGA